MTPNVDELCKVCHGACTNEHFHEQGDWVCQSCADRIANLYNFARSGAYLSWPNPPNKISRAERRRRQNTPSAQQRLRIFRRDNFKCHYCGSSDELQIDHKVPVAKGGDCADSNLLTACRKCNIAKSTMDYQDFVENTPPPVKGIKEAIFINYWGVENSGLSGDTDIVDWAIIDYIGQRAADSESDWLWLHYEHIISQMPMLRIKSKSAISKRLNKLEALGLIEFDSSKRSSLFLRLTMKCHEIIQTPAPKNDPAQQGA